MRNLGDISGALVRFEGLASHGRGCATAEGISALLISGLRGVQIVSCSHNLCCKPDNCFLSGFVGSGEPQEVLEDVHGWKGRQGAGELSRAGGPAQEALDVGAAAVV